jgi:hypothetical protein
VTEPITRVDYLARTLRFAIEDPKDLLVYFYEGNDLDDNLEDLARRFDPRFERGELYDPAGFRRFLDEVVIGESELARKTRGFRLSHNAFVLRSLRWQLASLREAGTLPRAGPRPVEARPAGPGSDAPTRVLVAGERVGIPIPLQGPSPELTEEELRAALWVFEQSLVRLADRFPETTIRVLYIPSALLCYELADERVRVQEDHHRPGRPRDFAPAFLAERSDALCDEIAAVAGRLGLGFHDARSALRRAGRETLLHGPRDWKHLNRAGQTVLADAALELLAPRASGRSGCAAWGEGPH